MAGTQHSATKVMLAGLAGIVGIGTASSLGSAYGTAESAWLVLQLYCLTYGSLCAGGLVADYSKNKGLAEQRAARKARQRELAKKHNQVTEMLVASYKMEKAGLSTFALGNREKLRRTYERRYEQNRAEYQQECRQLSLNGKTNNIGSQHFTTYWKWIFITGMLCLIAAFSYSAAAVAEEPADTTAAVTPAETRAWDAQSVPMPHLTDGSRYVSNPDNVISTATEQHLNQILKKMDDSLSIESAVVVVNHVADEDIFRFAQDLFNIHHIGKQDRGLVVVLAYQDHLARIHTGRSLEGDLTDIESARLQRTYLIPSLKAEQPDSGMIYLTEAIYNTLLQKPLPQAPQSYVKHQEETTEDTLTSIYLLLFGGWIILGLCLGMRYGLLTLGAALLTPNPFARPRQVYVGGGGFGGGSGGFGGDGSFGGGGGFSGGSSGGGGATTSW